MGERTSHAPGTISWVDLATTDLDGAKSFYGGLFGWEAEDVAGPGGTYALLRLGGAGVAGAFEQPVLLPRPHGCWNDLGTKDVDAAADFYRELFGWTIVPTHEVPGAGSRS